jgi:hypothetical protein
MVSTAGMLGADHLSATARELQQVLDEGLHTQWRPLAQRYLQVHAEAVAALAAWLERPEPLSLPAA